MDIDSLTPQDVTLLRFHGDPELGNRTYTDTAVFIGLSGAGDERRATFSSLNPTGSAFEWDAYIFCGEWVYGSSAERLTVEHVYSSTEAVPVQVILTVAGAAAVLTGQS